MEIYKDLRAQLDQYMEWAVVSPEKQEDIENRINQFKDKITPEREITEIIGKISNS